jgi:hypothetical protein
LRDLLLGLVTLQSATGLLDLEVVFAVL